MPGKYLALTKTMPQTGTSLGLYLVNPLTVNSALTVEMCDNKLPHKKGPSKQLFVLINCGIISFNLRKNSTKGFAF